jgi:integrase
VLPNVSPPVAAMIQLQQLTGMRAGEVVIMRPQDIDRSRPI